MSVNTSIIPGTQLEGMTPSKMRILQIKKNYKLGKHYGSNKFVGKMVSSMINK